MRTLGSDDDIVHGMPSFRGRHLFSS